MTTKQNKLVDGHFKTHYDDEEAAQKASAELQVSNVADFDLRCCEKDSVAAAIDCRRSWAINVRR
jgi:hypothetical protein